MKYQILEKEAIAKLCSLIRESHLVGNVIDDENIATNKTYSSKKIEELVNSACINTNSNTFTSLEALNEAKGASLEMSDEDICFDILNVLNADEKLTLLEVSAKSFGLDPDDLGLTITKIDFTKDNEDKCVAIAYFGNGSISVRESTYGGFLGWKNGVSKEDIASLRFAIEEVSNSSFTVSGEIDIDNETVTIYQSYSDIKMAQLNGQSIIAKFIVKTGEESATYGFNMLYSNGEALAFDWINSVAKLGIQVTLLEDDTTTLVITDLEGVSQEDLEELSDSAFKESDILTHKSDIFSCDYSLSTAAPTIEYTKCYVNNITRELYMDITITFDTAETFVDRTITILDSDCYWDIDRIDDYRLLFYNAETNTNWGSDNIPSDKASYNQLVFGGSSGKSTKIRIVGSLPILVEGIKSSLKDDMKFYMKDVSISNQEIKLINGLGEDTILPKAGINKLGLVTTNISASEGVSYLKATPIFDGIPYYEKHVYKSDLKLNGAETTDGASYVTDSDKNTTTITIPLLDSQPWKKIYNIYIHHMDNIANANNPCGFSHLTVVPKLLAYPSNTYFGWVNKTFTSSGGAVIEEGKYTLSGFTKDNKYTLVITITGTAGWRTNMHYIVVAD